MKEIFIGDDMGKKKGDFKVFLLIGVILLIFTSCTLVKISEKSKKTDNYSPNVTENLQNVQENSNKSADSSPKPVSLQKCDDSMDTGNNPYVQGTTKVDYNGKVTFFTDICSGAEYVTEYYCDGNEYKFYKKLCTFGCVNGTCLQQQPEKKLVVQKPTVLPEKKQQEPNVIPECFNGFRDLEETGTDCGGINCPPCGYGQHCRVRGDCAAPLTCNQRNFLCLGTAH